LLLAAMLAPLLIACEDENPRAALDTLKSRPQAERRAVIKQKLSRICPVPMSDSELERAAVYVERHAASLQARWIVGRLDRFDAESRICRGNK